MFASASAFHAALCDLPSMDENALAAARVRQASLTKPAGSLGRLEDIAIFLAGWQGREKPLANNVRVVVFAGNHGVTARGISAFPAEVTRQMVANFKAGGAAINALSQAADFDLHILPLNLERPTADFTQGPAMSEDECLAALCAGAQMVDTGLDLFIPGEMGIGNTAAASALCAQALGGSVAEWVGPGSGLNHAGVAKKAAVIEQALSFHNDAPRTPFEILRRLGGREIAAMAGAIVHARHLRIPVMLDGFICCSALAPIFTDYPAIVDHCLAGHCSAEPGHSRLLRHFGLSPILNLGMRLGEGSGAAVAIQIVRSAIAAHNQMATFTEAGVASGL